MGGKKRSGCRVIGRLVVSLGPLVVAHAVFAAPAPVGRSTSWGSFYVAYTTSPSPIPLGEVFGLTVTVSDSGDHSKGVPDSTIAVDALMPAHRHGMNLRPRITAIGDGRFTVDGMLFHMPGPWQILIDVTRDGVTERAVFDVTVE